MSVPFFFGHGYSFCTQIASVIATCKEVGASVAEIREQKANDAISEMTKNDGIVSIIGSGTDEAEEGKWIWASDGQVIYVNNATVDGIFTHWANATGQTAPTNDKTKNCMVMPKGGPNAGKWKDAPCNVKTVICEARPVNGVTKYMDQLDGIR